MKKFKPVYKKMPHGGPHPPLRMSWPEAPYNPTMDFDWAKQPFPMKRRELGTMEDWWQQPFKELAAKTLGTKPGQVFTSIPGNPQATKFESDAFKNFSNRVGNRVNFGAQGAKMTDNKANKFDVNKTPADIDTGAKSNFGTKLGKYANAVKPFISNIVNSVSKPPMPSVPSLQSSISMPRINMDNQRNVVERATRSTDLIANNTLNENTAAAVRNANLATKLQGLNDVNTAETNANTQQASQVAAMNAEIEGRNINTMNNYRDSLTGRGIAIQREQSANLANASDKSIAIDNEKAKRDLELKKFGVLKDVWSQSGVMNRLMKRLEEQGVLKAGELDYDKGRLGGRILKLKKVF